MVVVVFGVGHCGFFFFFGCDRCLKRLWVVVGSLVVVRSGVWVVVRLWLKWIVGRGSASWFWIGGLGSIDGGFETVNLLISGWIDWVDHR